MIGLSMTFGYFAGIQNDLAMGIAMQFVVVALLCRAIEWRTPWVDDRRCASGWYQRLLTILLASMSISCELNFGLLLNIEWIAPAPSPLFLGTM